MYIGDCRIRRTGMVGLIPLHFRCGLLVSSLAINYEPYIAHLATLAGLGGDKFTPNLGEGVPHIAIFVARTARTLTHHALQ
jgi:hypothetical protein